MKTEELYTMIQQKPVILDGATGSNLQKVGMKPGVCPEEWILENEDKLIDLQKSFVEAGTNILYAYLTYSLFQIFLNWFCLDSFFQIFLLC